MLRLTVQSMKILSILAVAVLVIAGTRAGFDYAMGRVADPRAGERVTFQVTEDDTSDTIAERLVDEELIRSTTVFTTQMRFAGELLPGEYTLEHGMSASEIIGEITDDGEEETADTGSGGDEEVTSTTVTVIEGWRMEQDAQAYADAGLQGGAEAFMTATQEDYSDSFEFLQDRPSGATLEGYLFPETYTVASDLGPQDAVFQMLQTFDQRFTQDMRNRAAEMGLSIHQVVTIASIVEREAAVAAERPTIAAVYLNRVEAGMSLGADPTVQFVIGTEADWWPTLEPGDTELPAAQSPYNTYTNLGLPPGPICSPSIDSIYAVLEPAAVDYLYFVAKNDGSGEHAFAFTLEEHEANIDLYLNNGGGTAPTEEPQG